MGRMRRCGNRWLSVGLVAALAAGCGDDEDTVDGNGGRDAQVDASIDASVGADASNADAASNDAALALSEPQVVGVAAAINQGEIEAGALAQQKATSAAAKDFASMMVTMHTAATARQAALGVTAAQSTVSSQVQTMANAALQTLQSTPAGAAFDLAYLQSQVTMHTSALELIDTLLMPNASTPALRAELGRTRTEVVAHLDEARDLVSAARDGGT